MSDLDDELQRALERHEFELYYQPKVSCASGDMVGVEALIRWNHPSRGLVGPMEFIPAMEKSGLIHAVGAWVLGEACRQAKSWLDAGLDVHRVAVNLSSPQFSGGGPLSVVRAALSESGLPANRLELELTESALMANVESVIAILKELRAMGVHISVDDFGTGYSSLSYLKHFPVDALKVDRSFVQDITADPDDVSITRAVIAMAHHLKLKVIAEGVETEGQLSLLIANHCDEIQGYLFSKPVPAAEMTVMLAAGKRFSTEQLHADQRTRTLLLVDDEENIIASLRRLLRRDGYNILTANGGVQGLELLAQHPVDVIISDQRMPHMTGVEFLRRAKVIHPNTVRIVLSGYTELESITQAINEGAIYKFLTKPWNDDLLRANIQEAFRHKELADENRLLERKLQETNQELAAANSRLEGLVEEKQGEIQRDQSVIFVAHEVLQNVPVPLVGCDDEGMVAFANEAAERVLNAPGGLVGSFVEECLPPILQQLLHGKEADSVLLVHGEDRFRVHCRRMGERSNAQGRLFVFMPGQSEFGHW